MLFFSSILLSFVVSIASILEHVCVPGALAIVQCCTLNIMRRGPLYCVILLAMCSLFIQHTHYRNAQTEKKPTTELALNTRVESGHHSIGRWFSLV